ncbi:MAG: tetratricopeptide repeat protein [Muribaculaceae bacterium]|nr:tetratricopeptide repeat protein [Muribaculaceae bacterium]
MRKFLLTAIIVACACSAFAGAVDEAKALYYEGQYAAALEKLEAAVARSPRDGNANYWLGATLVALGRPSEAEAPLKKAESKGVADAALALARIATDDYRPADAREWYDSYERLMRKTRKDVPAEVEEAQSRLVLMENMLDRVERIAVIDSIVVDADLFFTHYRLSPEAGRLVEGSAVLMPDVEMAFVPQSRTEILYAAPDSTDTFVLMGADILDDGTVDHPAPLPGDDLGDGGNAEYPFLMSDGLTLYFASDGDGSIGGYDIFLTRRGDDGFLQPQNIGMPYNSPYDDYLLAIDETTGAGWWATDRNRIPGKVTIYVFIPEENRVNVPEDDPNLTALARLSDISLTQRPGADYKKTLARIQQLGMMDNVRNSAETVGGGFYLPVASLDRIYTRLDDFRNPQARASMIQALECRAEIEQIGNRLAALRKAYSDGRTSESINILNLENSLDDARRRMKTFVNRAVSAESSDK